MVNNKSLDIILGNYWITLCVWVAAWGSKQALHNTDFVSVISWWNTSNIIEICLMKKAKDDT